MSIVKSAETHIQNSAPEPPSRIAAATPVIFPTPSVPASATVSARNGEYAASPPCVSRAQSVFIADIGCKKQKKRRRYAQYPPAAIRNSEKIKPLIS